MSKEEVILRFENVNFNFGENKPILDEVQMKYIPNIGKVINFIEAEVIKQEELEQIQKEMEDMYWKSVVYCEVCHPDPEKMHVNNFVEFGEPTPIENELTEYENPNQKKLFEPILTGQGKLKESDINSVQFGNCTWCNAEYIKCQYCGSVNYIEGFLKDNKLQCEGCDLTYKFSYRYIGNGMQETEVKIINNEDIY